MANANPVFETIKNAASQRSTEVLKQDAKVAYSNKEKNNNDATKIVYHAIMEVLIGRLTDQELEDFENTLK